MMSLTTIVGPLVLTQMLGRFSGAGAPVYFPGAAFALATVLALCALAIVVRAGAKTAAPALPQAGPAG